MTAPFPSRKQEEWRYADLDANDLRSAIARLDGNGMETVSGDTSGKP